MALGTGGLMVMSAVIAGGVGMGVAYMVIGSAPVVPTSASVTVHTGAAGADARAAWPPDAVETVARLEEENARLARQLAEIRVSAAARQAIPALNPAINPDAPHDPLLDGDPGEGANPPPPAERRGGERGGRNPRERMESRAPAARAEEQVRENLDRAKVDPPLSTEQKDAIAKILVQRQDRMRELMLSAGSESMTAEGAAARREKMEAIRNETRAALEGVITSAQIDALNLMPGGRPRGAGGAVPGGGGERRPRR